MKAKCPTCGKHSTLPDGDAGLLALCPACGTSYRAPEPEPEPDPLASAATAAAAHAGAQVPSPARASESNLGWILLWIGAGIAALVALAAISWGLYDWNHTVKVQKLAEAARLRDRAELLIATGHMKEAEAQSDELETFAAGSPWPEMRQMSDQVRQGLIEKKRAMLAAMVPPNPAPPLPSPGTPGEGQGGGSPDRRSSANPLPNPPPEYRGRENNPVSPAPSAADRPSIVATPQPPVEQAPTVTSPTAPPGAENRLDSSEGPYAVTTATRPSVPAAVVQHAPRPAIRKLTPPAREPTDEQIGAAITRGIDIMLDEFDPTTHLMPGAEQHDAITRGEDILCVYALMQCQQATDDPRLNPHEKLMKGLIDAMKELDLNRYPYEIYARGLRATALALYNRPEDRGILNADAMTLVRGTHSGGYTYQLNHSRGGYRSASFEDNVWDNSNSQYGLLGVWSAAEVAYEVPESYWAKVQGHWTKSQSHDGTWTYLPIGGLGTHSMTCAGLASLFVTHDYLDAPKFGAAVGRDPFTPPLARGLKWLETGDNSVNLTIGGHRGYDLYGLERVGLASGFKFFGSHEWYRELANATLREQQANGSWGNQVVETAYHLLFLARGRHPILMNKLRFNGYWANRPRDAANLARFVGRQLERPLNWQVVPLDRDWTDWMDSPILYLASHKPVPLAESDYGKIRSFVNHGGLLFMQADGASPEFDAFARAAAHKLFPDYEMEPLPPNHPLCSTVFKIKPDGKLFMVSNGSRILMLYADEDLSKSWQLRDDKNKPFPFEFGTNLFIYATGKRDLRNHLVSTYIPPISDAPTATYRIARLKYPGNWDPEPAAWQRFSRWFQLNTGYGLEIVDTPIKDLKPDTAPVAHLTGTARYDLTPAEADAIKKYVEAGGVLLVDLCGGTGPFDKSVQSSLLMTAFANIPSHVMPPTHPMLNATAPGMEDLAHPVLRPYVIETLGHPAGMGLPEEIVAGRGRVIFTSMDLTTGLLGTTTWGILGYDPSYAQSLLKNVILWSLDGHLEPSPVAESR